MPSKVEYKEFRSGVDRSQGQYPDSHTLLRDGDNVFLTSGRKIDMRPPLKRLDVVLDSLSQGYIYARCLHCVIAKRGDVIEHVGDDADQITTLYFDPPDYMGGEWTLLGAKIFNNRVVADILHAFDGCDFDGVVMRHSLDPQNPLRIGPEITKPSYVEDPWCPTSWGPTRPLHYFGKGEIGTVAPDFVPAVAAASEKLVSSRPDGNVAFSATANERVWDPRTVPDIEDVGEMWYWLTPDNDETLLQFVVSDRYDKLDDDRAWSAYVLEYLDDDGRWQKFVEVPDTPSISGTYTPRARDGRFGDDYNEICILARWEGSPCTWVRWRAQTGGPPITILEGGELLGQDPAQITFAGDDETTEFLTYVGFSTFRLHWSVELLRSLGGSQAIPLILGQQHHYVVASIGADTEDWAATTSYTENESFVIPTDPDVTPDLYFQCVTSGDSGGSEPDWTTIDVGETIVDGTVEWLARDRENDLQVARIDFNKYGDQITGRCDSADPEFRYTTNIRWDCIRYVPVFMPTLWTGPNEDTLVPEDDYELENDDGYIRVVWLQNLPVEGTLWTLKFAPTSDDSVVAATTAKHFSGGRYIFEGEVWDFPAVQLSPPSSEKLLAGVPHFPLLFGVAGGGGGGSTGNEVFNTAGSFPFDVPAGVTSLIVEMWGAGGGGGGSLGYQISFSLRTAAGGGGGGGGYNLVSIPVTPGETLTVEVGAGGDPGTSLVNAITGVITSCGSISAGQDGGNTRILRGAVVLAEIGGGQGGGHGTNTGGIFAEPVGGVGGPGGVPVDPATGPAGEDGEEGGIASKLITWPEFADRAQGGDGGSSGAGDLYGQGGYGADGPYEGKSCDEGIPQPAAGSDGRMKILWGSRIFPWFQVVTNSEIPLNGYERYHFKIQKRLTTDDTGAVTGDEEYFYGNEPGRESIFYIEKQTYYNKISGAGDAGFIDTAARTQSCGDVVAISGIQNRIAVHYDDTTHLYAFERDPTANVFLDRLHFGARGPTAEFFGGSMLLTQESFRIMTLRGDNFDSIGDNNVGRAVEDITVEEIHNARYWPSRGVYTAAVKIDGVEQVIFFYTSREGKVAGWTFAQIRDFTQPVVDSFHDVDQRFYMRTGRLLRYFDGAAGDGDWYDDVDFLAYQQALADELDPSERAKIRLEQFKYPARARFHMNDLGNADTMKSWLWMDVEQSTRCEVGFYERPEADARRKIGPTFNGTSLHKRRTPLVMRNQAVSVELVSRSLDGWRLEQIILGVAQSRR